MILTMANLLSPARLRLGTVLLAAVVTLAACGDPWPPPTPVSFPDDPRVLHGEWDVHLREEPPLINEFLLPDEELLITWAGPTAYAYSPDAEGAWVPRDAAQWDGLGTALFDPDLQAFVGLTRMGGTVTATVTPLAGAPATSVAFDVPAGLLIEDMAAASGLAFILGRTGSGYRVHWWNALTGAAGGSHAVGNASYGMSVSSNGRMLIFWNPGDRLVRVLDTADPELLITFGPRGDCLSNGLGEVSADGRWLAVADCDDAVRVYDLHEPETHWVATGVTWRLGGTRFADDSPELVWIDEGGHVRSYDVTDHSTRLLHQLAEPGQDPYGNWYWLSLSRATGMLAVVVYGGRTFLHDVEADEPLAALPELAGGTARLSLTASGLVTGHRESRYVISGTASMPAGLGWPELMNVSGEVYGARLHDYRPAAEPGPTPLSLPPPSMSGYATLAAMDDAMTFQLWFGTYDRDATEFRGALVPGAGDDRYDALLRRP